MNRASCHSCGCSLLLRADAIDAIDAWNTRATPAQPAGMREALAQTIIGAWNAFGITPISTIEEAESLAVIGDGDLAEQIKALVDERRAALPAERHAVAQAASEPSVPESWLKALIGNIREYERHGSINTPVANEICLFLNRALQRPAPTVQNRTQRNQI